MQKIGTYHLGHTYNLEDFLLLEEVAVFPGQEILVKANKEASRYIIRWDFLCQDNYVCQIPCGYSDEYIDLWAY